MLFYVPLESYPERYTSQLSAPEIGWFERNWIKHNITYRRVEGLPENLHHTYHINKGMVLDAPTRARHCFMQIDNILQHVEHISSDDIIYFDDFWHPGIEMIPYTFSVMNKPCPRMYAFCWAQSVDNYDFTFAMRKWIRPFERGIGNILSGVFVATFGLKDLLLQQIVQREKIHVVGLPFDSEEVMSRMPQDYRGWMTCEHGDKWPKYLKKRNNVVFSSRFDREKNPEFFMEVAEEVMKKSDTTFTICTGSSQLRSNNQKFVEQAYELSKKYPHKFFIKTSLTKEQYYEELVTSKVQFNCAFQDWISFTLLEASVAGCYPVYPKFRSFPETFDNANEFMYDWGLIDNIQEATTKIISLMQPENQYLWDYQQIKSREWIHKRMDSTWKRIMYHMTQGKVFENDSEARNYDPLMRRGCE
jgi:hypothetical protein